MPSVLLVDNYDSFTFNLAHYLQSAGAEVTVWRNDAFHLDQVERFEKIVLSPGPGLPGEHPNLIELIKRFGPSKSILGICLGQQAIALAYGGTLRNLSKVFHGVSTEISPVDPDERIFDGLPSRFPVGRYHSWIVEKPLPETLITTSVADDGEIMSVRHQYFDVRGVQFHPESVMTPHGNQLIRNWLSL